MKSSHEKDLKSVNTRSNLYICILILNEPHIRFKWYTKVIVINLTIFRLGGGGVFRGSPKVSVHNSQSFGDNSLKFGDFT